MAENVTYNWIWNEHFWFPAASEKLGLPQHGWKDLQNKPGSGVYYPVVSDIHYSFLLGIALVIVRYILETFFVVPLAKGLGITIKPRRPVTPNPVLEAAYKQHKHIGYKIMLELSKQTDLTERQVQRWMRKRVASDRPPKIQKFTETSYHLLCYGIFFIYGLITLWNKPWFLETKYCWFDWPKQHVSNDIYWYYLLELSFYWSLIFTLFTDHKRKDFVEMIVHHFATISLLYMSWMMNFVRVGTLILIVHDAADPWLAASKVNIYLKNKTLTDICGVLFILVWIATRLVIFPFALLYAATIEAFTYLTEYMFGCFSVLMTFLYVLLILHLLWSYSIYMILYNRLVGSKGAEDVRSDESSADSNRESEDEHVPQKSQENGHGLGCHSSCIVSATTKS